MAYTVTFPQSGSFQWTDSAGSVRSEDVAPGDRLVVENPCDALAVLNGAVDGGMARSGDETTRAAMEEATKACAALPGAARTVTPPPPPPPVSDPSATGADAPPPGARETAATLGAPEADPAKQRVGVERDRRPPGRSDGRPPAEQLYDTVDPLPESDLPALVSQNVPPNQVDAGVKDALRNVAPPGAPHPQFGRDDKQPPTTVADPVILFTGAYTLQTTDVRIPSRGFPLELTRVYRSGTVCFGPWGYNWDHSYNVFLRELADGGAAVWTGALSEEVYALQPDGSFEPPVGVFRRLERQAAVPLAPDRWVLADVFGMRQIFERPPGWPHADRIPMVRVEDRHDNAHALSYDAEGRLERVTDHAGRFISFGYGDCGLLEEVLDHTGRRWRYLHDTEAEHLEVAISPVTDEYPDGLSATYEYDRYQALPALRHNITRVLDPTGRQVVENRYGDEPGSDDFNRVVYQESGGFPVSYCATGIQYVPRTPDAINVPALRIEVVEDGTLRVYTFNYRGDLLDVRHRLVRDGSYRLVARAFRFDEQGNCVEARAPNGLGHVAFYDELSPDPRARGNLLRVTLSAPPTRPAASRDVARFTYEPRYQRLKTARDEAGGLTTYVFDYEVSPVDRGDIVRIEHPDVTLPDGTAQSAVDRFTYNPDGTLAEQRSPEGHRFTFEYHGAGPSAGYLRRTTAGAGAEDQTQDFDYDAFGYLATVTTAAGAVTAYERNALGQLVRLRKPAVAGATGDVVHHHGRDGRVRFVDAPRGDFDDGVIADAFIRHKYAYDVLGHVASVTHAINTARPRRWRFDRSSTGLPERVVDALGRVVRVAYDERGLPLRQTLFPGTPDERGARMVYDRNGLLARATDAAGRRTDHTYDSWDRLRRIELPGAAGERTTIEYTYGDEDRLERCVTRGVARPGGATVVLEDTGYGYDERGRLVTRTHGAIAEERWHDGDGRLRRVVDQRGKATAMACDALGRPTLVTDALGNEREHIYDADGDLVRIVETELDAAGAARSYTTVLGRDARGRVRLVTDPLATATGAEYDDRDLLVATTSPLGRRTELAYDVDGLLTVSRTTGGGRTAEHRWDRDDGGRVRTYTDPEGSPTAYEYEPEDRWSAIVTPDGRRRERSFDAAGQLETETAPSGAQSRFAYGPDGGVARIQWTATAGMLAVADLEYRRDGLGRPVEVVQGADIVGMAFDASGRLAGETRGAATVSLTVDDLAGVADLGYPDGRVDRYTLDDLERVASVELLAPAAAPATGPGLAAGDVLARYEYVGPSRTARRTLANGCVTEYGYDRGRRLAAIEHRDAGGAALARADYVHDADGLRRFAGGGPAPGAAALAEPDGLMRLAGFVEGFAAIAPPVDADQAAADAYLAALGAPAGAVEHEFVLDRADVRSQAVVARGGAVGTDDYVTGAAQRIATLTRTTAAGVDVFAFDFDDDGRCVADHRHRYVYDVMGRLREVTDAAGVTLLTQEFDAAGRVAERTVGGASETLRHLGARTVQAEDGAGVVAQRCLGAHPDELVVESAGEDRWAHQDGRLSLLAVTDANGAPLERYSYAPFGGARIWAPDGVTARAASAVGLRPIFGGHRGLGVEDIYDARARVYDAETGRFLQRDPRGYASGPNPYAYVGNDPVDHMDPSGEILPIIAAIVIIGALAGAGYSFYDADQHPERYPGEFSFKALYQTFAGAVIGGASALGGEVVLASAGMGSLAGAGAAGGVAAAGTATTLTASQAFVLSGTVSVVGGLIWRAGFNDLFPEYVEPPSVGSMMGDFVFGGAMSLAFRMVEAVGNPFSRAGWNTVRTVVAEANLRARMFANRLAMNPDRANQLGRGIAELRVARLHAAELQEVGAQMDSLVYQTPGQGQTAVFNAEVDVVTDSAWIQVKASSVPGRSARFDLAQAEYTAGGAPTGRSIFYVEPGRGGAGVTRDLLRAGVSEVRPLTPPLRGTEPFPLPFGGLLGLPMARVPWADLLPDARPPGTGPVK